MYIQELFYAWYAKYKKFKIANYKNTPKSKTPKSIYTTLGIEGVNHASEYEINMIILNINIIINMVVRFSNMRVLF